VVPVILTTDLEIANDYDFDGQRKALKILGDDLMKENMIFTVFTTADAAQLFGIELRELQQRGIEIGCHGLAHRPEENYRHLKREVASKYIKEATRQIKEIVGESPVSFRGPRMSTSSVLQKILVEEGYTAESSVCPQRLDFMNSKGGDIRWLTAPRMPYHPSEENPYKKGNTNLLEIPLSSFLLPFISGVLYITGLRFMKVLFNLFYRESKQTGKPVVYLFHTYEFSEYTSGGKNSRTGSERSRYSLHNFYSKKSRDRYRANIELIQYMKSFNDVEFFTCREYTKYYNERKSV